MPACPREWCDVCQKVTSRYSRSPTCRSCVIRARNAKHGNPGTAEGRRKGGLTGKGGRVAMAKHGNPGTAEGRRKGGLKGGLVSMAKHGNPGTYQSRAAAGYRSGRVRLGQAIERKRERIAALEQELSEATA